MDMAMIQFPPGCVFLPKPEMCIDYLTDKVTGNPVPEGLIFEFNPYDFKQLPDIFSAAEKKDLYFFTKLSRKGKIGKTNINRSVGNGKGSWHNDQNKDVFDPDNRSSVIGTARTFTYREPGSIYNRRFLMTEYQLPTTNSLLQYDPLKDPVLCHLRYHAGKKPLRVTRPLQLQSDPPSLSTVVFSNSSTLADFPTTTVSDDSASFWCQVEPSIPPVYALPDFDSLADDIDLDNLLNFIDFEEQGNDQLLLPPTC